MNSSDIPSRIVKSFGVNGLKNTIPVDSSTSTDSNGVATFDKGFPAITMQPLSAGGIPPSGKDMNGALFAVSAQQQWFNAGMTYPFNQSFSDAVSGYPKGAIVPSSLYTGQWLNLNESNGTPPESPTGSNTGWVPINNYGVTQITATSGSIVMSSLQAAKDRIIINGALTSNVNLIFPEWIKSWVVHNNCTGNFTITCRTVSGSGVVIISGMVSRLFCDGLNISDETYNTNNDMVGMVSAFAMISPPEGWLIADGSAINRIRYARLFSRIGTTYGSGDGAITFNIPDMRGEFIRGLDMGRGIDNARVMGSNQENSIQSHQHGIAMDNGGNTVFNNLGAKNSNGGMGGGVIRSSTSQTDASGSNETRPRNIAMVYCIKY